MATRVEMKPAPPTKPKFTDVNEANSSRIHISLLSDTSNKTIDTVGTSPPLISDNEIKLSRTVGSTTSLSTGTKPRLSPKPFSSDKTADSFRNVRPNLTPLKTSEFTSLSTLPEKTSGGILDAKFVEEGNSSSSQILVEDRSGSGKESTVDGSTFFHSEIKSITEAPSSARSKSCREIKEERTSQKLQISSSVKDEVQIKPSLAITSVNSLPHSSLVPECNTGSASKAEGSEKQLEQKSLSRTAGETLPLGVKLRTRSRPLSAIYSESPKEKKYNIETVKDFETASGNVTSAGSEKTPVRKPRPLSADLTSKFELISPSFYRRTVQPLEESKENVPLPHSENNLINKKAEIGISMEEKRLDKITFGGSDLRSDHRDYVGTNLLSDYTNRSKSEGRLEVPFKNKVALKSEDTEDISKQISKDGQYLSSAAYGQEKEDERKVPVTSDALQKENKMDGKERHPDRNYSVKSASSSEASGHIFDDKDEINRNQSSGKTIKRRISVLLNSVNSVSGMTDSSQTASEKANANVQQKIAELTLENTDPKPDTPRRSFQPRPLSADLTKKFSSQTLSSDTPSEKSNEATGVSRERLSVRTNETTDVTKEHEKVRNQTEDDVQGLKKQKDNSSLLEGSWRRNQSIRTSSSGLHSVKRPTHEGKQDEQETTAKTSMTDNDTYSASFNFSTDGLKLHDSRIIETAEDIPFKTVTAVLFESTAERHETSQGTETQTNLARFVGNYEDDRKVKKKQETNITDVKRKYDRNYDQLDSESGSRQLKKTEYSNEKLHSVETQGNALTEKVNTAGSCKDSWNQRIEPQLHVFHAVSEKAVSEYVPVATEDKATTLRARRSFNKKERVKPDEKDSLSFSPENVTAEPRYLRVDKHVPSEGSRIIIVEKSQSLDNRCSCDSAQSRTMYEKNQGAQNPQTCADTADMTNIPKMEAKCLPEEETKSYGSKQNEGSSELHCKAKLKGGFEEIRSSHQASGVMVNTFSQKPLFFEASTVKPWEGAPIAKQSAPKIERSSNTDSSDYSWISVHAQHLSGGKQENALLVNAVSGSTVEKMQVFRQKEYWEADSTYKSLDSSRKSSKDSVLGGQSAAAEKRETVKNASDDIAYMKSTERWRKPTTSKEFTGDEDERLPAHVNSRGVNVPVKNVVTYDDVAMSTSSRKSQNADSFKTTNQDMQVTKFSENVKSCETTANEPGKHEFPHEPKATYFAVTYHLPDNAKGLDYEKPSLESIKVDQISKCDHTESDLTKDESIKSYKSSVSSKASTSKITSFKYLDNAHYEQVDRKNNIKEEKQIIKESENVDRPFANKPKSSVVVDNIEMHPKPDFRKQRFFNVDAVIDYKKKSIKSSSGEDTSEMKTSPYNETRVDRSFKFQELAHTDTTVRKPDSEVGGILDIDALMAKYRSEPLSPSNLPGKSFDKPQESSFDQQKSKLSLLNSSCGYDWNEKGEIKKPKQKHTDIDIADESYNQSSLSLQSWKESRKSRTESSVLAPKMQNKHGDSEIESLSGTESKNSPLAGKPSTVLSGSIHVIKTDYTNAKQKHESVIQLSKDEKYSDHSVKNERFSCNKTEQIEMSVDEISVDADIPDRWNKKKLLQSKDATTKIYSGQDFDTQNRTDWKEFSVDLVDSETNYRSAKRELKCTAKQSDYLVEKEVRREDKSNTERWGRTPKSIIKRRQSMPRQLPSVTVDNKDVIRGPTNTMTENVSEHTVKPSVRIRSRSLHREETSSQPQDQLRQCLSRPSSNSKDTNLLVQQTDGRYGTWESDRRDESFVPDMPSADPNVSPVPSSQKQTPSRLSSHSSHTETTPVSEHREDRTSSLDHSSIDMDSTDGTDGSLSTSTSVGPEGETVDFTFLDQTQVLDSSAQKNRLQLSRKRTRRAPTSKSMRKSGINQLGNKLSAVEEVDGSWMFKDSTEEKPTKQEESDEETTPRRPERSPATPSQRIPVLPMLDTSAVKLRKRPESSDSATDTTSSTPSKSPKVPLRHGSVRVLPPAPGKGDGSEEKSPPWMKELKSKKRQSLHDSRPL
ncbi:uncharacterized protein KIAA1671 homolog [Protopterus annectens]|uniref:uncharacterized protein KIAA1671 homolog n=1 Tax=Protopterus annectens TaxID=7888 RepID=UPI001CFAF21D|nr:uncharacterized protein KIAA1671 homolog [Protopterus annectens]XP_043924423.1 uncharacterized protein KIAA1671 homolog [Protopterus annectens]